MYDIMHLPAVIEIGYCGENLFRTIEIDMRPWLQVLPNGVASIIHIRPGETENDAYITGATMTDGILRWSPTNADLGTVEGYGQMEIFLEKTVDSDTKRGKSVIVQSFVRGAIASGSAEPPEPQESWIEQMTELKTETVEAAEAAAGSASDAEDSAEGAEAWAVGQRNGTDVESGDPTYHNNSKYYAQEASGSATDANTAKNEAVDAKVAAETAQGKAETAALHYPYVDSTTGNWFVWNVSSGAYVDTEVHAKGDTGAVPAIAVGTVTTLQPDQSAYVQRRSGSPDEAPIFDFGIPKGETGQAENVYGDTIDMSRLDSTKVATAIGNKLDSANVYNGLDKTSSGYALDARQGKILSDSANNLRKGLMHVAKLSSGDWILSSGDNAAIGDILSVNGVVGVATAAITGGSTVLVKNTNWQEVAGGTLNKIIGDKADKVSGATNGNFAGLDSNGNLTDSGSKASDFLTSHQDISGKADKVSSPTSGNFAGLDSNGNLTDSGHKHSDYKTAQTAVSDPTASGTTDEFIATLSQDANGVITPAKKTVQDASQSVHGLMSAADKTKLDGVAEGANNYSLPTASSTAKGGILIGFTQSDKNYPVQLDGNNKAYVNVPWSNTTYSAGTGISLSGTTFSLASGVVTPGSAGPTANVSGANSISVPRITVDTYGRVTALSSKTYTGTTDTWRGIKDVLTSTSTTDSLSANMGKLLNDKITGFVIEEKTCGNTYCNANAMGDIPELSISKSGYTPIAVWGTTAQYANVVFFGLKINGNKLTGTMMNLNGSAVTAVPKVQVLYAKN